MNRTLLIAAGLGTTVFILVYSLFTGYLQPATVVVARYDLAAGTRLTADLLSTQEMPRASVPQGAYASIAVATGKVLTTARAAGDIVSAYVAGESSAAAGLPAQLAPNSVAIGVKVDQASGLVGTIREGQFVSVIALIDPQLIQAAQFRSGGEVFGTPVTIPLTLGEVLPATPAPTPEPTATPQPPSGPVAAITLTGLRVLVVPQAFRYEELPEVQGDQEALFANARTTLAGQQGSVILLEAPLAPVDLGQGLQVSPAVLLPLLDAYGRIHLALEPAGGLDLEVLAGLPAVDLSSLYEELSGFDLNQP